MQKSSNNDLILLIVTHNALKLPAGEFFHQVLRRKLFFSGNGFCFQINCCMFNHWFLQGIDEN